jgi:hypothetical protein
MRPKTTIYAGIDYNFRPDSYWAAPANPLEVALLNMKGQRRRQMVRDYYAAGKLEELGDNLLSDSLDDEARNCLGFIHPTFMGGEYLPDCGRRELEIVRIELESTTYDVISLRARPVGSRIRYSVVDEYKSEFIHSAAAHIAAPVLTASGDSLFRLFTTGRTQRSELVSVRFRSLI